MMCGASSLLTVHAVHIQSPVFAAVNAFAAVMAALQVVLVLRYRRAAGRPAASAAGPPGRPAA